MWSDPTGAIEFPFSIPPNRPLYILEMLIFVQIFPIQLNLSFAPVIDSVDQMRFQSAVQTSS
jgi:hypothetical protein